MKFLIFLVFISSIYCYDITYDISNDVGGGPYYDIKGPFDEDTYDVDIWIDSDEEFDLFFIYSKNYNSRIGFDINCIINYCFINQLTIIQQEYDHVFDDDFYIIVKTYQNSNLSGFIDLETSSDPISKLIIVLWILAILLMPCILAGILIWCLCKKVKRERFVYSTVNQDL